MNFYCVLLVFSILQTGFGIKVPGNFKYCPTKDFCEMIKEIDVVEVFSSCTQNPFIKFFSKAANTVLRGFVDKTNELITKAQEIIPCDINQIRHDKLLYHSFLETYHSKVLVFFPLLKCSAIL